MKGSKKMPLFGMWGDSQFLSLYDNNVTAITEQKSKLIWIHKGISEHLISSRNFNFHLTSSLMQLLGEESQSSEVATGQKEEKNIT